MSEPQRNLVSSPPPSLTDVPLGSFHLLAIGINRYRHWPRLATAVNGARELARLLADDYGFGSITTLLDEQATRAAIIGELARLVDILRPEDSLLVYFAGHGHLDRQTRAGAWIPVDAEAEEPGRNYDAPASWLQNGMLRDYLRSCPARHILVVSDSCFAGDLLRGTREAPPAINDAYVRSGFRLRSRQVLTAGGLQPVNDGGLPGHSVFTGFLLHTLRDHPEPWMLPAQVHARLRTSVAANADQQPLLGALHDTGNEPGGEFVFFRRNAAGIDEAIAARRQQLAQLERARAEADSARERFAAEIAAKKAEEQQLSARIAELQQRLGTGNAGGGLDQLVALVEQREREADELARLEEQARVEAARHAAELARLEAEERRQRRTAFEASLAKFRRIRDSRATTPQLTGEAWRELCRMWQLEPPPATPVDLAWDEQRHQPCLLAPESTTVPVPPPPETAPPIPQPNAPTPRRRRGGMALLLLLLLLGWAGSVALPKWQRERESALRWAEKIEVVPASSVTKAQPFTNSLGMKFVPVVTSLDGKASVLFSVWETRVRDYAAYAAANDWWWAVDNSWKSPPHFAQGDTLPVVNVSWGDAQGFCAWLTAKERQEGKIGPQQSYRLPTDAEWSWAVGIGEAEERAGKGRSPEEKDMKIKGGTHPWAYPWGKDWPPPKGEGNYDHYDRSLKVDDYEATSPVGSFGANPQGLYDLGGNVGEWVEDFYMRKNGMRVLRGGSWSGGTPLLLLSSNRKSNPAGIRSIDSGFRLVLVGVSVR